MKDIFPQTPLVKSDYVAKEKASPMIFVDSQREYKVEQQKPLQQQ